MSKLLTVRLIDLFIDRDLHGHVCSVILDILDSEYDGDPNELVLGDEMEYTIKCKNGKVSAEMAVKLPQGTILQEQILPDVYLGKVLRSLRRADPQVCKIIVGVELKLSYFNL